MVLTIGQAQGGSSRIFGSHIHSFGIKLARRLKLTFTLKYFAQGQEIRQNSGTAATMGVHQDLERPSVKRNRFIGYILHLQHRRQLLHTQCNIVRLTALVSFDSTQGLAEAGQSQIEFLPLQTPFTFLKTVPPAERISQGRWRPGTGQSTSGQKKQPAQAGRFKMD